MPHLPPTIVKRIDKLIFNGISDPVIALRCGTTADVVRGIRLGRHWRDLTGRPCIFPGKPFGERHGRRKLTAIQVTEILTAPECSLRKLATKYHVNKTTVGFVRSGKTWKHLHNNNKPQSA